MVLLMCKSDEHCAKHSEHISLDESHKQLQTVHEQKHDSTEKIQSDAKAHTH